MEGSIPTFGDLTAISYDNASQGTEGGPTGESADIPWCQLSLTARAFNFNLSSFNRRYQPARRRLPIGHHPIARKAVHPRLNPHPAQHEGRQVEAVELMIACNTITVSHAEALLKPTPTEQRTDVKPADREKKSVPIQQIEKL